jgi:hypothetical protein
VKWLVGVVGEEMSTIRLGVMVGGGGGNVQILPSVMEVV